MQELGVSVALGTGDYQITSKRLLKADVKITTLEKADSMLIKNVAFAEDISLIVIDELHFLGDEERGATMEAFLTKLLTINPNIQIVGLSATIPNYQQIADWFNQFKPTEVIYSNKRRVPLKIGYFDGEVLNIDNRHIPVGHGKKGVDAVCRYIVNMGKQVIVFVATRRNAQSLAMLLSDELAKYSDFAQRLFINNVKSDFIASGKELTKTHEDLFECMAKGVAFHHAGLDIDTRIMVEDLFRAGKLNVLVATSTLALGVNLPAFAVIVRDMSVLRMTEHGLRYVPIKVNDALQYVGRAGRPKYDSEGWGIFYIKRDSDKRVYSKIMKGELENIMSNLDNEKVLRRQILALVGMDLAGSIEDIMYIFSKSFYFIQGDNVDELKSTIVGDTELLQKMGFIKDIEGMFKLSNVAEWIVKTYIDPLTAYIYLYMIKYKSAYDYFSLLFAFGVSPDCTDMIVKGQTHELMQILDMHEVALTQKEIGNYEKYLSGIKVAAILWDWINETPLDKIVDRWNVQEGDLNNLRSNASWILASIKLIIENNMEFAEDKVLDKLTRLSFRVKYGVSEELVDLVKIRYVGRKRARALWNSGYKSIEDIANAEPINLMVVRGIGKKLAEQLINNAQKILKIQKE